MAGSGAGDGPVNGARDAAIPRPRSPVSRTPQPQNRTALNHHVRDRVLREDDSRIRRRPGIFARLRSFALNVLRANGVSNVSEAVYVNALSLDRLLAYGLPRSQ